MPDPAGLPAKGSGWILLAMGKYGAFELNYSSDVDLIVFFRSRRRPSRRPRRGGRTLRRLRRMVKIMQERTNGYVFQPICGCA